MKLKEYLVKEKKTQQELADECGITRGYLSQIINGTRTPSRSLAHYLEKLTYGKVKAEDILTGKASSKKPARVVNRKYKKEKIISFV